MTINVGLCYISIVRLSYNFIDDDKSVFYEVMIWHDVRYLICVFKISTLH